MKLCAVLAVVLATLVAQAQAANYIASVAYLTNPLPAGAIYVPEVRNSMFMTF